MLSITSVTKEQILDAALFETKVAAKLSDLDFAENGESCERCWFRNATCCDDRYKAKYHHECRSAWSRLKEAHLVVEEEMDAEIGVEHE